MDALISWHHNVALFGIFELPNIAWPNGVSPMCANGVRDVGKYRSDTVNSKSFIGKDFPSNWLEIGSKHAFQTLHDRKTFHRNFEKSGILN